MISKQIIQLFTTRDKAVKEKNRDLFLSTQVGELPGSSYEGYISIEEVQTEVISEYDLPEVDNKVLFVREYYFPKDKDKYFSFVTYFLSATKNGWKIYKLTYA